MIREGINSDLTLFTKLSIEIIEDQEIIVVEVAQGTNKLYHLAEKGIKPMGCLLEQ